MKFKIAAPLAFVFVGLSLAISAHAATYAESGDAGDLPASAQVVSGAPDTALSSITGTLTLTNGISDSDMFEIYINSPGTFSASLTAFVPGSNNFDSQLMLFSAATGKGVEADDDDPTTGSPSANLPAGSVLMNSQTAGLYYLLVSGSGRYATSSGGLIFPNFTDGTTDPAAVYGPTGPGGANGISGYTGSSNEGGRYAIALAGAQFVVVPEPGAGVFLAGGLVAAVLFVRRRRLA